MSERIVAVVVTYNRKQMLRRCLEAIRQQTHRPDAILVVENGSTDGTDEMLRTEFGDVAVLPIAVNNGATPAFAGGMQRAYDDGFDWIWVMDDDAAPAAECLATLVARMRTSASTDRRAPVFVPIQVDSSGREYGFGVWRGRQIDAIDEVLRGEEPAGLRLFTFVGPLISRHIIGEGILPNPGFYIWWDDIEFALRIQDVARVEYVPEAKIFHNFGFPKQEAIFLGRRSMRARIPLWKVYYGTRNYVYMLSRVPSIRQLRGFYFFLKDQIRVMAGELVYEPDRLPRVTIRLRAMADGLLGRMGKRV